MKFIKRLLGSLPAKLPQGMTEFNAFVDDVAELTELPNNNRLRTIIASFIMRLPPSMIAFSKWELAKQIKKAAANQVAAEAMKLVEEEAKKETVI